MQPVRGAPGWDKPKATPSRPRPGPQRTPAPSSFFSPTHFQNLTRLKRLNLDGNRLSTVPALPASLQELKLNDNHLQGLQHSSFHGAGSPRGREQRAQAWAAWRPWKAVGGRGEGLPRAAWLEGRGGSSSRQLPVAPRLAQAPLCPPTLQGSASC